MSLTAEEITVLLGETRRLFVGRRVRKVYHVEPHEIYLDFRINKERVFLFLSTRPPVSRFHALWANPSFPPQPTPFCRKLRAELSGKVLSAAARLQRNRAVRFDFGDSDVSLVGEFFGSRGNVVLLAKDRLEDSLWAVRRDGVTLRPRNVYRLPPEPGPSLARQHPRYLIEGGATDFPYSRALARIMAAKERAMVFDRRRDQLATRLRRERKRKERLLANLVADRREAQRADEYRRQGEALKNRLHESWSREERASLPDPRRSPQENMEFLFQKYRKLRDARSVIEERYRTCAHELVELDGALAALGELASDREGDETRLAELVERYRPAQTTSRKGPRVTPPKGVRSFVLRDHLVWVGRNARQNAELFRKVARGNDFFLHVAGRPGAVVIVRPSPGKEVSPEVLGEAAVLAAYYSAGRTAGAQDVDYTRVKHVRTLGKETGRFTLADRRTLRVQVEPDTLSAIFDVLHPP